MDQSKSDIKWLHFIRDVEYNNVEALMPSEQSLAVLEIGSGTGHILNKLREKYCNVDGLEVDGSSYSFGKNDVMMYDGKNIPFKDNSYDMIISFHVMEHVTDFPYLMKECKRVLRDGGVMIHVIPSSTWRFLTTLFYYIGGLAHVIRKFSQQKSSQKFEEPNRVKKKFINPLLVLSLSRKLLPERHGELGNVITEQWYFSKTFWNKRFKENGFSKGVGLEHGIVYWGHDFLRFWLTKRARLNLVKFIGSSSNVFYLINKKT
ncbi:methyltransferase domain-containing protein [bacterium]|nr:methyltransferase domain-containing protein [bacterium]